MRYSILLLLPLLLFSKPFKVATYNVENLFDTLFQGLEYNEYIPGRHGWNKKVAEVKLNHTAEVLCDLDADIVALQEVENAEIFEALKKRMERVGCQYRYGAITTKNNTTVQVALLSRFPIQRKRELQVSYAPGVRNILEVEVKIEDKLLTLFVNHWKSKSRKGKESKRIAYAKVLKKRIDEMSKNREYIILGDLNTNYDAYLTLPKRLNDTGGRTGLNHILHTVEGNEAISESQILKAEKGKHYNLWLEVPFKERWSHKFYGHKSTLDHILLPALMFDGKGIDYVNDSFMVFKRDYLLTKKGYVNRWQIKAGKHTGKGYSDHLPLVAVFDTKPYLPSKKSEAKKSVKGKIEQLYEIKELTCPMVLKDTVVVLKRGRYAVLKQSPKERGIFVFGASQGLKEGEKYDLKVQEIGTYMGLKEITAMAKLSQKGRVDLTPFYMPLAIGRQNEVVRNIEGVYKNRHFYINGKKIPIYFKNRKLTPKNGAKLKIDYAHLGYYKTLQLVVYSHRDFKILKEK